MADQETVQQNSIAPQDLSSDYEDKVETTAQKDLEKMIGKNIENASMETHSDQ